MPQTMPDGAKRRQRGCRANVKSSSLPALRSGNDPLRFRCELGAVAACEAHDVAALRGETLPGTEREARIRRSGGGVAHGRLDRLDEVLAQMTAAHASHRVVEQLARRERVAAQDLVVLAGGEPVLEQPG